MFLTCTKDHVFLSIKIILDTFIRFSVPEYEIC